MDPLNLASVIYHWAMDLLIWLHELPVGHGSAQSGFSELLLGHEYAQSGFSELQECHGSAQSGFSELPLGHGSAQSGSMSYHKAMHPINLASVSYHKAIDPLNLTAVSYYKAIDLLNLASESAQSGFSELPLCHGSAQSGFGELPLRHGSAQSGFSELPLGHGSAQSGFSVSICEAVPADVSTEFQFAVVTFSTGAVLEIEFDSTLTKEELKTQVLKIPYRPGATYTHKGLDIATTLLARRQNRLAGLSIMKFVFVLTDSMSSNRLATEAAARNLRKDAYVVSIGIGSEVSHKELHKIASPPDSYSLSYVYSVENFDALNTLIDRLIDATCEKCGVSSKSDIVGVIDNLSESAMNREEFQAALNGLTYIAQHL
ncbi:uncharacterized protein LOC127835593 [Dreissena polymorpha]|uniref:uncharacterized protein LOC127835593 n=1 Tax=Dreissena polymorpha TaxID=45954 RepID=UPI002263F0D3|nr:uncharacterized protein LOC127835593 [Dreissena polymorpha]